MIKTLLIPGLDGSFAPHWQHWWERMDSSARIVEQTSWADPCPDQWLTEMAGAVLVHPGAVLVGHSLGAIAIARLLTQFPQLKVGGALLVAPAETSRHVRTAKFGTIPETPLGVPTIVAASRNDPWMSQNRAQFLARAWQGDFIDMGDAGHINTASGFGPWPEGRALRDLLWSMTAEPAAAVAPPRMITQSRGALPWTA